MPHEVGFRLKGYELIRAPAYSFPDDANGHVSTALVDLKGIRKCEYGGSPDALARNLPSGLTYASQRLVGLLNESVNQTDLFLDIGHCTLVHRRSPDSSLHLLYYELPDSVHVDRHVVAALPPVQYQTVDGIHVVPLVYYENARSIIGAGIQMSKERRFSF